MIYLLTAILFSTAVSMVLKFSETRKRNRLAVTTVNYVIAFSISFFMALKEGVFSSFPDMELFLENFLPVIRGEIYSFDAGGSFFWAVISGIPGGIFYFLGFIYIQKSIRENGVSITGAFSKLSIFVPVTISILIWKEIPSPVQWAGIILAVGAILSAYWTGSMIKMFSEIKKSLLLVLFTVGFAEFSNKFFQNYASTDYKSLFLFTVFFTAFTMSFIFTVKNKKPIVKKDILTGIMVGIPNMFTSYFLIQSFNHYKAAVVFPIYSASTIVMISLGGLIIFREKITRREAVAIILTTAAVILMNAG